PTQRERSTPTLSAQPVTAPGPRKPWRLSLLLRKLRQRFSVTPVVQLHEQAEVTFDPQRNTVVLNHRATETHPSVVLLPHLLVDTQVIHDDCVDAEHYGGPRVIGIAEPDEAMLASVRDRYSTKDGWVVVVEDLGSDLVPLERWRDLRLSEQNARTIVDQAWE